MVEPFAAVILNSLLSGRSTLRSSPSLNSVARVMKGSPRTHGTSDFLTPQPRRVKGKERAEYVLNLSCHLSQCQEWSSCAKRHSLWCPHQSRFMMMDEFDTNEEGPVRRHGSRHTSPPLHSDTLHYSSKSHGIYGGQRRHASYASELAEVPRSPPSTSTLRPDSAFLKAQAIRSILELKGKYFQLGPAWDTYTSALECGAIDLLTLDDILAFSTKFADAAEVLYKTKTDLEIIQQWGYRLADILSVVEPQTVSNSPSDYRRKCLSARAMALVGDLQNAASLVHAANRIPMAYEEKSEALQAYEGIVLSAWRHHSWSHVLEFIIIEWPFIGSYMTRMSSKWHYSTPAQVGSSLRHTVQMVISEIENPALLLASKTDWNHEQRQQIGNLLIEVLCNRKIPTDALNVYKEMKAQRLSTPVGLQLTLSRTLARADMFEQANTLFASLTTSSVFKYYLSTGLYIYAHQGDTLKAEQYYDYLSQRGWASDYDIAMLLYSYAKQGKTEPTMELFDKFFPEGSDGARQNSPSLLHYSILILGYAQQGDIEGISRGLTSLSKAGLVPDVYIYTSILKAFALRGDIDSVTAVLNQMRSAGVHANAVSYTTVITLLARRKDAVSAEAIYKRAISEGVIPDRRMVTSLMNAHAEAGSWKGVIRIFDYIKSSPSRHIYLSVEVYNTLLKAYVLIGAPFHAVSKLFSKLESSGVKPDAYTYALLIQSACDSGKMKLAADIFYEMDAMAESGQSETLVNAYILTIIMAGFLRIGDKIRAKAVLDEMKDRGIQPTSVSYGTIIKAYGNEKTEESIQIAERFVQDLMNAPAEERAWNRPSHGRKTPFDHIYGPLIRAHAQGEKVEDVERLLQEVVDAGGTPSLGMLTALLDAYGRTSNTEAAVTLWPQIFKLGQQYARPGALLNEAENDDAARVRLQGKTINLSLSIYINILSTAGRHLDIAATWKDFRSQGLVPDSHNWNHLAVALVRAGEPERAFEILEKVILPYQRLSSSIPIERDMHPESPLLPQPTSPEAPSESPMRRSNNRATAVAIATSRMPATELENEDHADDPARALSVLHQISPAWAAWRPHTATLSILLMVLSRLQSGALIEPITPNAEVDVTLGNSNPSKARDILNKIYQDYPDTVRAVLDHEVVEKRRLGGEYDATYNWR
ncbi:hypothetical protein BDZ94DRAFT_1255416 [Collybia nuda]|uniref:Pentacotripeptide-repeat region of PRORP domain-containing protein n=1 Tax=Collybia nuda TaxID=64659 RepID=A0A9P6CLF7_9AGAR|nr:hypothetical protein BDZ94DRAFT_1255416 [Collybia nuda]